MGMATWRNNRSRKSLPDTVNSGIFDRRAVQSRLFDMVFAVAPIHDDL
jgi:hypothetical protein